MDCDSAEALPMKLPSGNSGAIGACPERSYDAGFGGL